mgnify:CR=1 FL=1
MPGVIEVDADSRVVDVIALAGGMTADADETYLNLAGRLDDGEKIYVPTREEVLQWESQEQAQSLININTATSDRLCELSGIGESKAEDIISYRREKEATLEKLEDYENYINRQEIISIIPNQLTCTIICELSLFISLSLNQVQRNTWQLVSC